MLPKSNFLFNTSLGVKDLIIFDLIPCAISVLAFAISFVLSKFFLI
jgi:hypothetical protein